MRSPVRRSYFTRAAFLPGAAAHLATIHFAQRSFFDRRSAQLPRSALLPHAADRNDLSQKVSRLAKLLCGKLGGNFAGRSHPPGASIKIVARPSRRPDAAISWPGAATASCGFPACKLEVFQFLYLYSTVGTKRYPIKPTTIENDCNKRCN